MTDAERFEAFVRAHQDMVFATAVRLLGRSADAEDVAQTVFLKAFERFAAIGTSPSAAGWLKTVTTNISLNHLTRYRSRWRLFSELRPRDGRADDEGFEAGLAAASSADAALDQAGQQRRLEIALRALPDHQRVPLVLFHFEEHSYQAIAQRLGISLAKVKSDIHRGREALKIHLSTDHADA